LNRVLWAGAGGRVAENADRAFLLPLYQAVFGEREHRLGDDEVIENPHVQQCERRLDLRRDQFVS